MSVELENEVADDNKPKKGEFYILRPDMRGSRGHGVVFENGKALRPPGQGLIRPPGGGFPALKEIPRLRQSRPLDMPNDLDASFEGYWLVSAALKKVFEIMDTDGFAFMPVDFILADGSEGPLHYLCDVIREIDALDEVTSRVKIKYGDYVNGKFYSLALAEGASLAFKKSVVGSAHVFMTPYTSEVFCDRVMHDALRENGFGIEPEVRGVWMQDAADC